MDKVQKKFGVVLKPFEATTFGVVRDMSPVMGLLQPGMGFRSTQYPEMPPLVVVRVDEFHCWVSCMQPGEIPHCVSRVYLMTRLFHDLIRPVLQ